MHYLESLVTLGLLAGMMWAMLKFMLRDIQRDLSEFRVDANRREASLHRSEARTDHLYEENNRLYHILLDMLQKK